MSVEDLRLLAFAIFGFTFLSLLVVALMLLWAAFKLRNMDIPVNATFAETLHFTPLMVVVAIDLLDLVLDVLAAPLSWVILDRLGLKALRGVAAVEAIIPGTQIIPTMTLCWFGVRLLGIRH